MFILYKLGSILGILCAIAIFVFGFTVLGLKKSDRWESLEDVLQDRTIIRILATTIILIITAFSYGFILDRITQRNLIHHLRSYTPQKDKIWINKAEPKNSEIIINELINIQFIFGHRPSAESLEVTMLIDHKLRELRLTKSVSDSSVYLVYYTDPALFTDYHVGEIRSNRLNSYLKANPTNL